MMRTAIWYASCRNTRTLTPVMGKSGHWPVAWRRARDTIIPIPVMKKSLSAEKKYISIAISAMKKTAAKKPLQTEILMARLQILRVQEIPTILKKLYPECLIPTKPQKKSNLTAMYRSWSLWTWMPCSTAIQIFTFTMQRKGRKSLLTVQKSQTGRRLKKRQD